MNNLVYPSETFATLGDPVRASAPRGATRGKDFIPIYREGPVGY